MKKQEFQQHLKQNREGKLYQTYPQVKATIDMILSSDCNTILNSFASLIISSRKILANEILLSDRFEGFTRESLTIKCVSLTILSEDIPEKFMLLTLKEVKASMKNLIFDAHFSYEEFFNCTTILKLFVMENSKDTKGLN